MFSLENLYYILYTNLFKPVKTKVHYFYPFGSTKLKDLKPIEDADWFGSGKHVLCFDQEPIFKENLDLLKSSFFFKEYNTNAQFLLNSEISSVKDDLCKEYKFLDLYYFFHGFAALNWYRDYKYISTEYKITKHFMSLNHLTTNDRSYRLLLVSHFINRDILEKGIISLHTENQTKENWINELNDPNSKLSIDSKNFIQSNLTKINLPLIADTNEPIGSLSAQVGVNECIFHQHALWHVVSETVFYYPKLHLTEKIFRPIVNKRPFILVGAPGNLAYLKRYGFKTFDKWIDESYDNIIDNDRRIEAISNQIEKICKLSMDDLNDMHKEMLDLLNYNFQHFYGDFRKIITTELIENYKNCVNRWNLTNKNNYIDISTVDLTKVKQLLLS